MRLLKFKRFNFFYDPYLLISIILLSFIGLIVLYSASQGNSSIIIKQSIFVFFGIILMIAVSQPDPAFYKNISGLFLVFSIFLVILTIIFGNEINGAKRWLDLGFFTLQPSELVKIALPIFLASYLYDKSLPINLRHTFISILVIGASFFSYSFSTRSWNKHCGSFGGILCSVFSWFKLEVYWFCFSYVHLVFAIFME